MSPENCPESIVHPRFNLMYGNPDRFHILRGKVTASWDGYNRSRVKLTDFDLLVEAIQQTDAELAIVDPLQSYLDAELNRAQETRPVMDALAELAQLHHCTILLIRHLSKARTGAIADGRRSAFLARC